MNTYRHSYSTEYGRQRSLRGKILTWWYGLPAHLRSPKWFMTLSCLTILALLLGFHQVMQSAVKQAELLHMSAATHAQAEWRCHALQGERMRASCMKQLNTAPSELAESTPPINTAALELTQR